MREGSFPVRSKLVLKESVLKPYELNLRNHRTLATQEQKVYKETLKSLRLKYLDSTTTSSNNANRSPVHLVGFGSADYQMRKLVAHWGASDQPSKTYYYQKLMNNVFGYCDGTTNQRHLYVVDETVAAEKNADHVCSILYLYSMNVLPLRIKSLLFYMDSAGYLKSKYVI